MAQELSDLTSPAVLSERAKSRPVFLGTSAAINPVTNKPFACDRQVWFSALHPIDGIFNLTLIGLKAKNWKGGVTVAQETRYVLDSDGRKIMGPDGKTYLTYPKVRSSVNQNVTIQNMVFDQIGDVYYPSQTGTVYDGKLAGKGAILFTYASGNKVSANYFRNIKNQTDGAGLIHALYLTQVAERNIFSYNTIDGSSGSAVKITDYSNDNQIYNNKFYNVEQAVTDRWCGSRNQTGDQECIADNTNGCPSWNNYYNDLTNFVDLTTLGTPYSVVIDRIPETIVNGVTVKQTCDFAPPNTSGIRLRTETPSKTITTTSSIWSF